MQPQTTLTLGDSEFVIVDDSVIGSSPGAGPAYDMPWGQRVARISDPDGNAVNLTQTLGPTE